MPACVSMGPPPRRGWSPLPPIRTVKASNFGVEPEADSCFLEVLLGVDLNARLRAILERAARTDQWKRLTFRDAMSDRGALESRLLKVAGLGLKSARDVLDVADEIAKDFGSRRESMSSQMPLEIPSPSVEEATPFFDAVKWQHMSVRLRNVLAAAEHTSHRHRTIADFLENREGFRGHVLRQSNLGKKTEKELIDLVSCLIKSLRKGLTQAASDPTDSTDRGPEMVAPESDLDPRSITGIVEDLLLELRSRDADIIRRREGIGGKPKMTLEALGTEYGLTRERIRQIEQKARRRLVLVATSIRLKATLRHRSAALWDLMHDGSGVLLVDDLDKAVAGLGSESRFVVELAWGSVDSWLSETRHATAVAWMDSEGVEPLLTALNRRLRSWAQDHSLPSPAANLKLTFADTQILAPACRLAGLFYDSGYICSGRLRGRKQRAVRLHAMLGEQIGEISSVGSLIERYHRRFADDLCSSRDALIVMGDAPHLFIDVMDDQWSSLNLESVGPVSREKVATASDDSAVEETEPGTALDQSIVSVIERILERDGPLRFGDLRMRAMDELQDGQSMSSIGPIVITSGRFGRVAPGTYGLPQHLRDVAQCKLFPDSLLAIDQCRWFVTGLHAGCPHGDFPAWTPLLEMRLCQWAESTRIDSALFDSLLAVVEPERWPGSQGDREYWSRIKSRRGHYWLEAPAPPLLDSTPPLDRLLSAAIDAKRRGGSNWIAVNRVWSKRVDHDGAASLLALMVATRVLLPSEHWQRHHQLGPEAVNIINLLTPHRMRSGTLHWEEPVGRQIGAICSAECDVGWVARAELMQLVGSLALADEPEPVTDASTPTDALEQKLKQLRLRRQAALIEGLMQEDGTQERAS